MRHLRTSMLLLAAWCVASASVRAQAALPDEDGYDLWLRYRLVSSPGRLAEYRRGIHAIAIDASTPLLQSAARELQLGLSGLLGRPVTVARNANAAGVVIVGTRRSAAIASLGLQADLERAGAEGYMVRTMMVRGRQAVVIAANSDAGVLYGAFAFLRHLQVQGSLASLREVSTPRIQRRILDHWDNLDRSVERGYAGLSLWAWDSLPAVRNPRYRDYARANASIGINGTVLTNVNANATVLTAPYLAKVAALAHEFRPWGIRVYLTARFSAPIDIGRLKTADPLDPSVRKWWKDKTDEVYRAIPDFGGWLVKANSEGQPGPQDYRRTHADGANMLADAVGPHGGIVMWRAFVYSNEVPVDRVRQAADEFVALDGKFRPNVMVQVKNGALDFQPREPFHPLFGAMPKTPLVLELQVTKEYLGQDTHLAFLGPLFEEVLDADTWRAGRGTTVARVVDGSVDRHRISGVAGVANIGTDRNWTGSQFNQANWYAYGRLAWDHQLPSWMIAGEWIRQTLSNDPQVLAPVSRMMLGSREALVNYMTPLGLHHIMAEGHHYGPGPWVTGLNRADWTSTYYHRADTIGIGFDRTATGSNAVAQYAGPVRDQFASRATVPDENLLWFHHVRWTDRLRSGRTLWDELVYRYSAGVDSVRGIKRTWEGLAGRIDGARYREMDAFLGIQVREAKWWRDASLAYFQTFSRQPFPAGYERPAHPLEYYQRLRCPADRTRPRCDGV
ncbi:MAG: alpha-glucuronidase [Cytophagaceae bacterium]|nr:alpha-glucuronidase [Gemmatimonadaceae bacterium]